MDISEDDDHSGDERALLQQPGDQGLEMKSLSRSWGLFPYAILLFLILVALSTLEPFYCAWFCPLRIVYDPPAAIFKRGHNFSHWRSSTYEEETLSQTDLPAPACQRHHWSPESLQDKGRSGCVYGLRDVCGNMRRPSP